MIDIVENEKLIDFGKKLGYSKVYTTKDFKISTNIEDMRKKDINLIMGLEKKAEKDSLHQRISGLNQVYCKIAVRNKTAITFNLQDVLNARDKHIILGRIMQNIMLCRKYKVKMIIASFAKDKYGMRNPKDLMSLGISLGMTPKEAYGAVSNNLNSLK